MTTINPAPGPIEEYVETPEAMLGGRDSSGARPCRRGQSFLDAVLAVFSVGRRAGGVNAHAGAGHEHRLMTIVPAHDIQWLTARALDLEHLTTTGCIARRAGHAP